MPSISNVRLSIESLPTGRRRRVTVNYSLRFNSREEAASSVFEEKVVLRGDDPLFDNDQATIATGFVKAVPGTINRSFSSSVSQSRLDEDGDTVIFGIPIAKLRDELYARVSLSPFVPNGAHSDSNVVTGQFGPG